MFHLIAEICKLFIYLQTDNKLRKGMYTNNSYAQAFLNVLWLKGSAQLECQEYTILKT